MTTPVRRFAAVAVLAAGLLTSVTPVHSHAQAPSVGPSVRAVLTKAYTPLNTCVSQSDYYGNNVYVTVLSGPYMGSLQDKWNISSGAVLVMKWCTDAAGTIRGIHVDGALARNAKLRYVLDQQAACALDEAQRAYDSLKMSYDIQRGDARSAKADFEAAANARRAADAHLAATIPYIGKL